MIQTVMDDGACSSVLGRFIFTTLYFLYSFNVMKTYLVSIATVTFLFIPKNAFAVETSALLLGAYGTVFLHESGHALTTILLGGEVLAFKPYPTKLLYVEPDGRRYEKWALGVVMMKPFEGEHADQKNALVAAMGSVGNLLSVFLLAPILPKLTSPYSKNVLDSMLFYSSFDMAFYTTTDLIFASPQNDWSRVSKLSGVPLVWYFISSIAGGFLANEYRYYWHKKAFPTEISPRPFSIGFTTDF